jgi:hypothetical protein
MADEADRASEYDDKFKAFAQSRLEIELKTPTVKATGLCFNCGDLLLHDVEYCDEDCEEDHKLRIKMKRQNGGI